MQVTKHHSHAVSDTHECSTLGCVPQKTQHTRAVHQQAQLAEPVQLLPCFSKIMDVLDPVRLSQRYKFVGVQVVVARWAGLTSLSVSDHAGLYCADLFMWWTGPW